MDIKKNSFYLLNASLDDNKMVLAEKANDLEFELGEDVAQKCLTDLINPKRRLFSEIRWFLDEDDDEINTIIQDVNTNSKIETVSSDLSIINTIDYWFDFSNKSVSSQLDSLEEYYDATQDLSCEDVLNSINAHRKKAGFPDATFTDVSQELNNYLSEVENKVLDSIFSLSKKSQSDLVFRFVKRISSVNEPYPSWGFPQVLLSRYELMFGDSINDKEENISSYVNNTKSNFNSFGLTGIFDEIEKKLSDWESISNPINYINFTNGVHRRSSMNMLCDVREFVLFLNNEKKDYSGSLDLNKILVKYCTYFPDLKQDLEKGASTIANNKNIEIRNQEYREKAERQRQAEGIKTTITVIVVLFLVISCLSTL